MISSTALLRAADEATTSLLNYGLGGIVLAVFVVPIYLGMARAAQRREEARIKADEAERTVRDDERKARFAQDIRDSELRAERERKLVDALVATVEQQRQAIDQQKLALEQWRRFEEAEEKTHTALLAGLAQVTATLAQIGERIATQQQHQATTAAAQAQLAQLLGDVATQIQTLKRPA